MNGDIFRRDLMLHKFDGLNKDISTQINMLENIIMLNSNLKKILIKSKELKITDYYIGAGCIAQTVWNFLSDNPIDYGISDIDFVYFDLNLEESTENLMAQRVNTLFSDIKIPIDVKNEARVHLWYENHFGYKIEPYNSLEESINSWPTTATSIGLRIEEDRLKVYAPFGLNDLFGGIVRANKVQITEEIYNNKVNKWHNKWPNLTIIPW